jgi:xanthine dehydrogenase small subunit
MSTRNHLVLYINGQRREVRGGDCFLSLSDFLRCRLGLVGTKIVCSEGDCGSCTVLVGQPCGDEIRYRPIDSCIRFMFQLDGVHVVTIEGLANAGDLTPIQQSMVDCHGSQCGFCTPGFVMAMTGLCDAAGGRALGEEDWRHGLTGNLCRCTGYTSIIKAGIEAQCTPHALREEIFSQNEKTTLTDLRRDTLDLRGDCSGIERRAFCPTAIKEAVAFRRDHPTAKIVAGATDVGVQLNKRTIEPAVFLDLNRIAELEGVQVETDGGTQTIVAGARATWTELLDLCKIEAPEFAEIVSVFGSPQIRHVGTIGGNIINASPIADSLPFLMVMEAELELVGPNGRRRVNINSFYQGYKKFDLRPDELLASVRIPLLKPSSLGRRQGEDEELLRLYKVSRRRDLDISTFTAAIRVRLAGDTIADAALAYGAVGPTVLRLRQTELFLRGQPFSEETMRAAGDVAVDEITPISDVRGSADYRYQLARNVLLKFYHEQQTAMI